MLGLIPRSRKEPVFKTGQFTAGIEASQYCQEEKSIEIWVVRATEPQRDRSESTLVRELERWETGTRSIDSKLAEMPHYIR